MFHRECWMECPECGRPGVPPINWKDIALLGGKAHFREGQTAICDNCESDLEVFCERTDREEEYLDVRVVEKDEEDE